MLTLPALTRVRAPLRFRPALEQFEHRDCPSTVDPMANPTPPPMPPPPGASTTPALTLIIQPGTGHAITLHGTLSGVGNVANQTISISGVANTMPMRDMRSPLSISRTSEVPRATSFSENQTLTPNSSSRSWRSLAAPCRSPQA